MSSSLTQSKNKSQFQQTVGVAKFTPFPESTPGSTTNLKSKLSTIEDLAVSLRKELDYLKLRLQKYRDEKEQLEMEMIQSNNNLRRTLLDELNKIIESLD